MEVTRCSFKLRLARRSGILPSNVLFTLLRSKYCVQPSLAWVRVTKPLTPRHTKRSWWWEAYTVAWVKIPPTRSWATSRGTGIAMNLSWTAPPPKRRPHFLQMHIVHTVMTYLTVYSLPTVYSSRHRLLGVQLYGTTSTLSGSRIKDCHRT